MTLGSKEHYELMEHWERRFKVKPAREAKKDWPRGIFYCHGETNEQFKVYCEGYALARAIYQGGA